MFYSTDLLKRKTPLGTLWLAGNGKKLRRGEILQISIDKTCKQIMDPEVPHSLRLQAVLASGVCTIFDRQSQYLLEDFQVCLSNVKAASTNLAETKDGPILARPGDINMMEEISINADVFAPAAFPTGLTPNLARRSNRLIQENEDLILMPSIPDSVDDRAKSVHSPRELLQGGADPDYFVMEVMDAPVFPEGFPDADFAFPLPGEEGYPADFPADPYNMNEENNLPVNDENLNIAEGAEALLVLGEEEGKIGHTAQKEGTKPTTRRRRYKKALVDDPAKLTIDAEEYKTYQSNWADLLISRPRAEKRERPDLFSLGPATGPWPEEMMHIWERCMERCKQPFALKTPDGQAGKGGARKRARENMLDEDILGMQQMQDGNYQDGFLPPENMDFPMPEEYFPPPGEEYNFGGFSDAGAMMGAEAPGGYGGGEEFETERLRAALYGTPGAGNYRDAMFQLGLTPASDNENMMSGGGIGNRGRHGRYSNASLSRRDSRGGRLSERSSDPGTHRSSDLLEDMQAVEGNLADALPLVGDDGDGAGKENLNISQFRLVEESGPSMPHTQLTGPMEQHSKTFQVLASLRSLTSSLELSLNQATFGLNRMEAAQVFSHVLVGSSKGFIGVNQDEAYGDITITFFN